MTPDSHDQNAEGNWLHSYISHAIRKNLCTRLGCTTCGAREFWFGLFERLSEATGQPILPRFNLNNALAIAAALASLPNVETPGYKFESAVRFIITEIWSALGEIEAERRIEPLLNGTWAGNMLARMKVHHRDLEDARRARDEYRDPVRVQQRREEKRRLKQEKHEERLALKKQRDRIWREKQEEDQ